MTALVNQGGRRKRGVQRNDLYMLAYVGAARTSIHNCQGQVSRFFTIRSRGLRWFSWDPLLSYFTAILLLGLGLSIATKNAPPRGKVLDKAGDTES
jgi:hypothetical protein